MAFGNPYGETWNVDEVLHACDLIAECGVTEISLADTVGLATTDQVEEVLSAVIGQFADLEIGAHLHARPAEASERIRAAFQAGCRRFDSAIGGLGGCPFAQDVLVGNIPTEVVLAELRRVRRKLASDWIVGRFDSSESRDFEPFWFGCAMKDAHVLWKERN